MADNLQEQAREKLVAYVADHTRAVKERESLQGYGYALYGLSLGLTLGFIVRWRWLEQPISWLDWILAAFTLLMLVLILWVMRHNARWIKAHRAAALNMLGLLQTSPNTSLHELHFDQALCAFNELIALAPKKTKPEK